MAAAEISILVFWSAFFGALSAQNIMFKKNDSVENRLLRYVKKEAPADSQVLIPENTMRKSKNMRQKLIMAGLNRKEDLEWALRLQRLCLILPLTMTLVLFIMRFPILQVLAAGALFSIIFVLVPRIWILHIIFKRRKEIERHLPSTIDLLTLCLEAGMSFDTSLLRVAAEQRRVSTNISREFILTNQEILAGKSREEALKNLAWRTNIEEMRSFVGAVLQSLKLGTNLVQTLRVQATALRKKRREMIRELILKTPVKLIFPLLFFIFPMLLIIILGPSLINIFRHLSSVGY